jgi:hypothetical protein
MKYPCLGFIEPGTFEGMTEEELHALLDECFECNDRLRANRHAAEVHSKASGNRGHAVLKNGKLATTDGWKPRNSFATQLKSQHPGMKRGMLETRPVAET